VQAFSAVRLRADKQGMVSIPKTLKMLTSSVKGYNECDIDSMIASNTFPWRMPVAGYPTKTRARAVVKSLTSLLVKHGKTSRIYQLRRKTSSL